MHKETVELWLLGLALIDYLYFIKYSIGDAKNKPIRLYTHVMILYLYTKTAITHQT
jgi:hypothetical protein